MSDYKIEENRLQIADEAKDRFTVVHDAFGSGIAYSADTLLVFDDEEGVKTFAIAPGAFKWLIGEFFVLKGLLYYSTDELGKIALDAILGFTRLYVWDAKRVYYLNGPVKGAEPASFQDLGHCWSRDARQCFYQERSIPGADPASFRIVAEGDFAADKDRLYASFGRVVAEHCPDPVPLGNGYYEIAGAVFFCATKMPDADLSTFRVRPVLTPEDKRAIWKNGGPKDEEQSMAVSGFTAYDSRYKYNGPSHPPGKTRT